MRRELLRAGFTADEVRRGRRAGELAVVRRGAYVRAPASERIGAHRDLVGAVVRQRGSAVVSHVSAAVLHGLPCWGIPLDRVHLTRGGRTGGRVAHDVHLHTAPLAPDETVLVDGVVATSPVRTVVDLARSAGFEAAVVVADAALAPPDRDRPPLLTPDELVEGLLRAKGRPGAPQARRVVAFADRRSGSVGESRSRVALATAGLPPPTLQWAVPTAAGTFWVDFAWPPARVVGEFDGRVKYGRLLRPGQDSGDVVYEEKVREDALRAEDLWVARWTWTDLGNFAPVAARLAARLHTR